MIKGIKKALNSTIGTKDFQPLDEMIKNATQLLPDKSSTMLLLAERAYPTYQSPFAVDNIRANCDGGCYLAFSPYSTDDNNIDTTIYINNVLKHHHVFAYERKQRINLYYPIWFKKGDIIKIVIKQPDGYIENIGLNASFIKRNVLVEA